MKKETRVALITGSDLEAFRRIYVLTVFRGKILEGVEFFKARNTFELSLAITSSKYYNEIRVFIVATGEDPFINDSFYIRVAKPIIVTRKLESIVKTYGLSIDEARAILNSLVKSTFLEITKFVDNIFNEALKLLKETRYGESS